MKGLEAQAIKNQQRIDTLREDPLVNERIARRELNLQPDDERVVRVSGRELSALRLNMADIGRGFGRDRTTVVHACHLVEDLRDDEEFDRMVALTERVALAAFRARLGL